MNISQCSKCGMRVLVKVDGTCPNCGSVAKSNDSANVLQPSMTTATQQSSKIPLPLDAASTEAIRKHHGSMPIAILFSLIAVFFGLKGMVNDLGYRIKRQEMSKQGITLGDSAYRLGEKIGSLFMTLMSTAIASLAVTRYFKNRSRGQGALPVNPGLVIGGVSLTIVSLLVSLTLCILGAT